jgi:hypothetical protein
MRRQGSGRPMPQNTASDRLQQHAANTSMFVGTGIKRKNPQPGGRFSC